MKKKLIIIIAFISLFSFSIVNAQVVKVKITTTRGKKVVFADTVYSANIKASLANWSGFFHVDFKEKGFEGAFNFPLDYQGEVGVDETVKMTFQRKDAHYFGVLTVKRKGKDLILLTKSPKEIPPIKSEITQGVWSNTDREQTFKGYFEYQTYTYDEEIFQKRDFTVKFEIEVPLKITWRAVKRAWVPEHLPDPLPAPADSASVPADTLKNKSEE